MATIILPLFENYTSYCTGDTGKLWKSSESLAGKGLEFRVNGQRYQTRGTRFQLNFWDADCVGRDVDGGPVTQRASASLSAQASCIYAGPRRPEPGVLDLNFGDLLVCPELDLVLKVVDGGRWADPGLEILSCQPATEDHSGLVETENAKPRKRLSESYLSG